MSWSMSFHTTCYLAVDGLGTLGNCRGHQCMEDREWGNEPLRAQEHPPTGYISVQIVWLGAHGGAGGKSQGALSVPSSGEPEPWLYICDSLRTHTVHTHQYMMALYTHTHKHTFYCKFEGVNFFSQFNLNPDLSQFSFHLCTGGNSHFCSPYLFPNFFSFLVQMVVQHGPCQNISHLRETNPGHSSPMEG